MTLPRCRTGLLEVPAKRQLELDNHDMLAIAQSSVAGRLRVCFTYPSRNAATSSALQEVLSIR